MDKNKTIIRSTTVVCVRDQKSVVIASDGQVTLGTAVIKSNANKIRTFHNDQIIVGFAGSTADALALFDRLEKKCEEFSYNLKRACVELAKDWRTDRYLRRLESMIIAADKSETFLISGTGDVLEPQEGIVAIGSGGNFALSAARALRRKSDLSADKSDFLLSALAALNAKLPPDPIATIPSCGSNTSPVPLIRNVSLLSAAIIIDSSLRR